MRNYYDHMNLLHISYAAFENTNTEEGNDYIRARRYLSGFPGLQTGRVGIRHMGSRASRYKDFRVYQREGIKE